MTMLEGTWVNDRRGDGRAVRVSAHTEAGFLVVSTWKAGTCVGTVRLLPTEAAELIAGLSSGLALLAEAAPPDR
jgi:predicted benzoate:H+ symporter BenE